VTVTIERADEVEADLLAPVLTALCRRSKAHWGYPPDLLARWADDLHISPADIVADAVLVARTPDDVVVGFARLGARADHTQLKDLWVEPASIGTGLGRTLWDAAVALARTSPHDELRFAADPNAEPFYRHMGARRIGFAPSEVVDGRTLPLMAFDLRS
jgi:GNAT superfamily N-acetyltransferase